MSNQQHQFKSMYQNVTKKCQIHGHNDVVWCMVYTNAGDRIITGADDALVKVWSTEHSCLLATFRGHSQGDGAAQKGAICDLAVDPHDTMVASGDTEGIIRVWSLETAAALAILTGHTSDIDVLEFGKSIQPHQQYLVSMSGDFTLRFWKWSKSIDDPEAAPTFHCSGSNIISTKCTSRRERENCPGKNKCTKCKIVCADVSPGGSFFATGYSNGALKVYEFGQAGPVEIFVAAQHSKQIDSVRFSHSGDRIVTASTDGTARIWFHSGAKAGVGCHGDPMASSWTDVQLNMNPAYQENYHKEKCDEAVFTCDDSKIICTVESEHVHQSEEEGAKTRIKYLTCVWSTSNYQLLHCLDLHKGHIAKIIAHPRNPDIVVTTGRDALTFVLDAANGEILKRTVTQNVSIQLQVQGIGGPAVDNVDAAFAPDGMSFAVSNLYGSWAAYGWGDPTEADAVEVEQFFHTDYLPVAM